MSFVSGRGSSRIGVASETGSSVVSMGCTSFSTVTAGTSDGLAAFERRPERFSVVDEVESLPLIFGLKKYAKPDMSKKQRFL